MAESEAPPVLSARTGMSTTLSVNATALSGPWATVVHNQRQQPCSRTALWNLSSVAQLECPALCRGTYDWDWWNTSCMITGTSTHLGQYLYTALAWRCIPVGGFTGCGCATPPPVDPRRPTELTPNVPIRTHEERPRDDVSHDLRHFHQLVLHTRHRNVSREGRRHGHQLFRQLRITYQASRRDVLEDDLGHFNNLLGNRHKRIDETEHIHQLVHLLRLSKTSASCSTVRCWTRSCGPRGSPRQGGREPLSASPSSSDNGKNSVTAGTAAMCS